jgi:hypothetical protein
MGHSTFPRSKRHRSHPLMRLRQFDRLCRCIVSRTSQRCPTRLLASPECMYACMCLSQLDEFVCLRVFLCISRSHLSESLAHYVLVQQMVYRCTSKSQRICAQTCVNMPHFSCCAHVSLYACVFDYLRYTPVVPTKALTCTRHMKKIHATTYKCMYA